MTKRFLLSLVLGCCTLGMTSLFAQYSANPSTQSQPGSPATAINWYTNYQQAVSAAKQSNRPIVLFFTGTDWCGWCKKMHQEIFSSPDFIKEVGNNFIFVELDFPMNKQLPQALSQQNIMLKQKFGVTGYPTVVILDPNENFIAETGYRPGGGRSYAEYLRQLLQ